MNRTRLVRVEKYATLTDIADGVEDAAIDVLRLIAVREWRSRVADEGYQPIEDPDVQLVTAFMPRYVFDPETGEHVKLPDRQIAVAGRVLPDDVALPPAGFAYDHIEIPRA